jgi:hypothetical protein
MSSFTAPRRHRLLVISDLDLPTSSSLSEHLLQKKQHLQVDLIIIVGSLLPPPSNPSAITPPQTLEQTSSNIGTLTTIISQLENIVCRIIYIPSSTTPTPLLKPSKTHNTMPRLTPNSLNMSNRFIKMSYKLGIVGYTETLNVHNAYTDGIDGIDGIDDVDSDDDDALDNDVVMMNDVRALVEKGVRNSAEPAVTDGLDVHQSILVTAFNSSNRPNVRPNVRPNGRPNGRPNVHTRNDEINEEEGFKRINPLLNYLQEPVAQQSHLLHIATSNSVTKPTTADKIDATVNNTRFVVPGSLRLNGDYVFVEIGLNEDCRWSVENVQFCTIHD